KSLQIKQIDNVATIIFKNLILSFENKNDKFQTYAAAALGLDYLTSFLRPLGEEEVKKDSRILFFRTNCDYLEKEFPILHLPDYFTNVLSYESNYHNHITDLTTLIDEQAANL